MTLNVYLLVFLAGGELLLWGQIPRVSQVSDHPGFKRLWFPKPVPLSGRKVCVRKTAQMMFSGSSSFKSVKAPGFMRVLTGYAEILKWKVHRTGTDLTVFFCSGCLDVMLEALNCAKNTVTLSTTTRLSLPCPIVDRDSRHQRLENDLSDVQSVRRSPVFLLSNIVLKGSPSLPFQEVNYVLIRNAFFVSPLTLPPPPPPASPV